MGDVAMTVPVIRQLLNQYPELSVTFVSEEKFAPLFTGIARLNFFAADIRGKYNGIFGLYRLYRDFKKEKQITAVADLHDVLRTKILNLFFKLTGYKVKWINKGRQEKKALTRKHNKRLVQLPTTFQRYTDVFRKLGYPVRLTGSSGRIKLPASHSVLQLLGESSMVNIGLAPFAKHREKMYPVEEMEKVVAALSEKGYKLFLLGAGVTEIYQMKQWEKQYPGTLNVAGELSLDEELVFISHLKLMVSMDSANMHLASLFGVPVVSIWGATHPFAGFYGFGQDPSNIVQADLFCRPCSVFGDKKCYRGDWACMQLIKPQQIVDKIEEVLHRTL
jgi:ADP-heptose:LPS heptosyltransferase